MVGRDIGHARRQVVDDAGALPVCSVEAETRVAHIDGADAHGARGAASCVLGRNGHTTTPLAGRGAAVAGSIIVVLQSAVVVGTGPQTVSRLASRDASSHDLDLFDVVDAIGRLGVLRPSRLAGQLERPSSTGPTHLGLDVEIQMAAEGGRSEGLVAERAVAVLGSLGRRVHGAVEAVLAAIDRVIVRCRALRPLAGSCHSAGGRRRGSRHRGRRLAGRFCHGFFCSVVGRVEAVVQSKSCHSTSLDVLEHFAFSEFPQCFHATPQRRDKYEVRLSL